MYKIIPFRKEITFDTMLYEITSISLEHTLTKNENFINGNFIVSGEYRVTETSINTLPFNYELPFTISIDSIYDISKSSLDISDFYYEIVDNKALIVNIEVKLDNVNEILIEREEKTMIDDISNDIEEDLIEPNIEIKNSLFSNLDTNDKYVEYKVYIVRENDSIDSIINKYKITRNILEEYNDVNSIKIGDKIVIPYVEN